MKSYFSQFGEVTRLRLSRNKQVSPFLIIPFHPWSLTKSCPFVDWCFETLRIHRIPIRFSCSDRSRNYGQLPSLGTHPRVQNNSGRSDPPETLGWSKPKIPSDPERSKAEREEECRTSWTLLSFSSMSSAESVRVDVQPKSDEQKESIKKRLLTREEKKRKQLAELGIEYDFAGYAGKTVEGEKKEEVVAKEEGKKGGKKGRKSAEGAGVRLSPSP